MPCDGGVKRRRVYCSEAESGVEVADELCPSGRPQQEEACNTVCTSYSLFLNSLKCYLTTC